MSSVWLEVPRRGAVARARAASIADLRAIERKPYRELLPSWSILGMIEHAAAHSPGKPAIVVLDKEDPTRVSCRFTYAELAAFVRATANRLCEVSGTARPIVSILTPLLAESFIASWAGASVGIANPINPFLRIEHVANIMNAAGTTVLVCGSAADGPGAWNDVGKLSAMVPTLREVWYVGHASGSDSFRRQIESAAHDRLVCERPLDPDRTAALLHTGGTTAAPKLVRLTERGKLLNAWCCATLNGNGPDEVIAVGMPYFHVAGAMALALPSMVFGQTMVIVSPEGYRSPRVIERFWDVVEMHGVTLAGSAPTTAAAIVAGYNGRRPPRGFCYWAGGATVPVQVAREFAEKFGVPLREGWGMTELHGGSYSTRATPNRGSARSASPSPTTGRVASRSDHERPMPSRSPGTWVFWRSAGPASRRDISTPPAARSSFSIRRSRGRRGSIPVIYARSTPTATSGFAGGRKTSSSAALTTSTRSRSRPRSLGIRP